MRISVRDKRTIHYKVYNGKTELTETIGGETIRLGEYELSYGDLQSASVYVSIPRGMSGMAMGSTGNAQIREYGVSTEYRRYIISEADLGITEETIVWVDADVTEKADYRVTRAGHSFNHFIYEVKEY